MDSFLDGMTRIAANSTKEEGPPARGVNMRVRYVKLTVICTPCSEYPPTEPMLQAVGSGDKRDHCNDMISEFTGDTSLRTTGLSGIGNDVITGNDR